MQLGYKLPINWFLLKRHIQKRNRKLSKIDKVAKRNANYHKNILYIIKIKKYISNVKLLKNT